MIKTIKYREILFVYALLILVLSLMIQNYSNTPLLSIAALPVIISVAVSALKNQNWLFVCFYALCAEVYYIMLLCIYVIKGTETSWRFLYAHEAYNAVSLRLALMSMLILSLVYIFMLFHTRLPENEILTKNSISGVQAVLFLVIYTVIIFYYGIKTPSMGMRLYTSNQNIMILSLFRVCCLIGWVVLPGFKGIYKRILTAESAVAVIIIALLSINGYRFLLFENVIMIIVLNLSKIRKIRMKTWIMLAFMAVIFYIALTVLKSKYTGRATDSIMFNHEKNLFYSLNALIANMGSERMNTYLSTIKNLLPKAITGSTDLNTGGMLMKYIGYEMYLQSNVTMGGYYLTEAYANMHESGIYIVSLFFAVVFSAIEKRRAEKPASPLFMCIYYGLISQTYNFVYYGSSNYVKFLVYYIIFAMVILFPLRKTESARRHDSQK